MRAPFLGPNTYMEEHHTRRRASIALAVGVLILTAGAGVAQEGEGLQKEKPAPTKAIWEVPGNVVLPLEELLDKGLVPMVRKAQAAAKPTLVLIKLETGETVWSLELTSDISALNVVKDVLVLAVFDRVAGVSLTDGKVLWQQPLVGMLDTGRAVSPQFGQIQWFRDRSIRGQGIGGAFLVVKDRVFVCVGGTLYALDPMTGQVAWQQKLGFSLSYPLTAVGDQIVAATVDNGLGALSADSGKVLWALRELKSVQPILVIGEELYAASHEALFRVDPRTGNTLWKANLSQHGKLNVYGAGDQLVVKRDLEVAILKRDSGEVLWTAETSPMHSTVSGKQVYYSTKQHGKLVCVSVTDQSTKWQTAPAVPGVWGAFVSGDTLVALSPGMIEGHDIETGKLLWNHEAGPGVLYDTSTWAADEKAAYFHLPNEVRGFSLRTGRWVLSVPGQFFFVHWMQVLNGALYLHSGKPGEESLGAIPLKEEEQ